MESKKKLILIYYSFEPEAAKSLAAELRAVKKSAQLRDAAVFNEPEECDNVIIQDDVSEFYRDRLKEAYGDKVLVAMAIADPVDAQMVPKKRGRPKKARDAV